jgi:hypothetical protein
MTPRIGKRMKMTTLWVVHPSNVIMSFTLARKECTMDTTKATAQAVLYPNGRLLITCPVCGERYRGYLSSLKTVKIHHHIPSCMHVETYEEAIILEPNPLTLREMRKNPEMPVTLEVVMRNTHITGRSR